MSLIDRRGFLRAGGAGAVGFAVGGRRPSARPPARSRTGAPAFRHGVASGDPLPRSVIIWTRVTPTEESLPGSGRGPAVEVRWQVSADTAFRKIVATGVARTGPEADHTVKVDVTGLRPATAYYYRFLLGRRRSPTGRTRTAPAPSARVSGLCFGVVSCANWEAGYFSAYRHLAARDDVFGVIHLGDYLYEYGTGIATAAGTVIRVNVPAHEIVSLADYRMRHALYKTDPDLQALHARHPWMVVWDDHELANDAWSGGAQNHFPAVEGPWSTRRAAARQAYFEWMPIRVRAGGVIYRRLRFGRLAELTLLDLRSFRSKPVWWTDTRAPGRTMTGRAQMTWLKEALSASRDETRWRLVGNSVMMAPLAPGSFPAQQLNALNRLVGIPESTAGVDTDHWDGFPADRSELLAHLYDRNIANTVFLTGDVHTSWANDLPLDAAGYPAAPSVAAEFVVPSVTSDNFGDLLRAPPRTVSIAAEGLIAAANPHVRWCDLDAHGFGVLDLRPERALMSWYRISDRTRRDTSIAPLAALAVADGAQRLRSV